MIKRKHLLTFAAIICLTFGQVQASSLVQFDVKKSADNSVDVTFYTTDNAATPMVTRKSNNKYVVLMPNVSGKNTSQPDLTSVKDIITNVDVKNVDDGMSGYTKITFITTKPVNIKTHIEKAKPLSQEEKAAKDIIAHVKTEHLTSNNVESVVPVKSVSQVKPVEKVVKNTIEKSAVKTAEKPAVKIAAKQTEKVQKISENVKPKIVEKTVPVAETKVEPIEQNKLDIKEIDKIVQNDVPKQKGTVSWLFFIPIIVLYMIIRLLKRSIQRSNALKASFKENLAQKPYIQENYEDIINDPDLNWRERYQKFVEESKNEIKERKYNFIQSKTESLSDIDKKRLELEKTLAKTPEVYNKQIELPEKKEVQSEDDVIQKEFSDIKLTAFANPVSLHATQRNRVKKVLPKTSALREGKFEKLQENALNFPKRKFKNANLSVADLISKGSEILGDNNESVKMFEKEQDYIMSSLEEYFKILDREQKAYTPEKELSQKVAKTLSQIKPSMKMPHASNPIKSDKYLNGLVIKSGYNIDENRGFYLVSLDGITALVGRVKDEIFVLKKFDENVDKLQVRLDNENVYMVKAGDFKSLVDTADDKMGVLIEL